MCEFLHSVTWWSHCFSTSTGYRIGFDRQRINVGRQIFILEHSDYINTRNSYLRS